MAPRCSDTLKVADELPFCLGSAVVAIAHAGQTRDAIDDLNAAKLLLDRHIALLETDRAQLRADVLAEAGATIAASVNPAPIGWTVHDPDGSSRPVILPVE